MTQAIRIDTDYVFYKSFKQSVSEGFTQSETFTGIKKYYIQPLFTGVCGWFALAILPDRMARLLL
jgi:phage terminase large subunit-like protein